MSTTPRPYWPPLWAGLALGAALFISFVVTGHGLGASGFFTRLTAEVGSWFAPATLEANRYLGGYFGAGSPLASWISWEVIGAFFGALAGGLIGRRIRPGTVERGVAIGISSRFALALLGGLLTGFGARLARGCTSGLGLSGGAALAVGGFVFLLCFFAAGFVVSYFTRRIWQ